MAKTTINELAKLLKNDDVKGDSSQWGVVQSLITDGEGTVTGYNVSLGGSSGTIETTKGCGATVGDTVLLNIRSNGEVVPIITKGGDADAAEALDKAVEVETDLDENYSTTTEVQEMIATTASGSKIYYQTSAPSGGTYKVGDTWFDTDGGYAIYRWNGSSWAKAELDTGAFAAGSITASEIAAGAVTAAKITAGAITATQIAANTITAAEIASGAITADEIATGAITADKIAAGAVTVSKIENGSTNYAEITSNGLSIVEGGSEIAKFSSTELNIDATGIINFGDSGKYRILRAVSSDNYWMRIDSPRGLFLYGRGSDGSTAYNPAYRSKVIPNSGQTDQGACRWWSAASGVTGYFIGPSGSSKYLKSEIKPVEDFDCAALYELPVSQFLWNGDENLTLGLIADDVADKFPVAAIYRENYRDGNDPADWNDRVMIAAMLKLIQEQHSEIESLKARVSALESEA